VTTTTASLYRAESIRRTSPTLARQSAHPRELAVPRQGTPEGGTTRRELSAPPPGLAIRWLPGASGIADLLAGATTEVLALSTLSAANPAFRCLGGQAVRPGVRFRVLFPDSARTSPKLYRHLVTLALAGADVRTLPEIPTDAVVVDQRVAILPEHSPGTVAELSLPSVVTATWHLFERLWPESVPLVDRDAPTHDELTPRERETLKHLARGATDDLVAAELGIAVRTVRRTVATLMNRLGARSRFQAGVKAAERGWLLDHAP
jgi:DNA-binding CsgD family transcriptional regulator